MLFRFAPARARSRDTLQRALQAAVAAHRAVLVRELFASHGASAFAAALSTHSGRVMADALSMLPAPERAGVLKYLDKAARARLLQDGGGPSAHARLADHGLDRAPAHRLLVWRQPS